MFDPSTLLPMLAAGKNGGGMDMNMLGTLMNMMNSGGNSQNNRQNNNGDNSQSNADEKKTNQGAQANCREPKFWDSPARDANSIPPHQTTVAQDASKEKSQNNNRNNNQGSGKGGADMLSMLSGLMGAQNGGGSGGDMLGTVMSMMGNQGGGGTNNIMSMLPLLTMMNNRKTGAQTATAQSADNGGKRKSGPFSCIEKICPLDMRMRMHYYLSKNQS